MFAIVCNVIYCLVLSFIVHVNVGLSGRFKCFSLPLSMLTITQALPSDIMGFAINKVEFLYIVLHCHAKKLILSLYFSASEAGH